MRPKAQRHTASFYASATFGMAFLWLVLKSQIYTSFFSSTVSEAASGQSNYYLYLIAMTLLCACAIVIRRPLEIKLLTNPVFIIVLSAMGAAGALTMYLLGGDFGQLRIVYLIGMTLLAAASFALLLSWSILLAKTDATTGIRCGILAYALGFVLHILLGFVGNTVIVVGLLCSGLFCSGLLRSARKASTLSRVDESFAPAQRPKATPPRRYGVGTLSLSRKRDKGHSFFGVGHAQFVFQQTHGCHFHCIHAAHLRDSPAL
jgi:hypothetical protein